MIQNIILKSEAKIGKILEEFCEEVDVIPTHEGKQFFKSWNGKVPVKLIRQCIFAGIFWANQHPDDIVVVTGGALQ